MRRGSVLCWSTEHSLPRRSTQGMSRQVLPCISSYPGDNGLVSFLFHYSYHTYGNISPVSTRSFTKPPPDSSLSKHPFPHLSCSKATLIFAPECSHGCPVATFVYQGSDLAGYCYATSAPPVPQLHHNRSSPGSQNPTAALDTRALRTTMRWNSIKSLTQC